ncbi:MAG: LysM peptidoglycan-binding domain-containing M23 family metallopeptidase [Anaerolineae bacterium]|nr:LysM peptidoglycan-binding domain-containing M23 family metallopeptidase [Anaerolineae bacterium]
MTAAVAFAAIFVLTLTSPTAAGVASASPLGPTTYLVRPGDTLASIAERYGLTTRSLMRLNAIQDPRQLYAGQVVLLGTQATVEGAARALAPTTNLMELSRACRMDPEALARANGLLRMTELAVGLRVVTPPGLNAFVAPLDALAGSAPRVVAAMRHRVGMWDVLRLNPVPGTMGQRLLVPTPAGGVVSVTPEDVGLPFPVMALDVSPQPVARGDTAAIRLTTAEPVACTLVYLGTTEECRDRDGFGMRWVGLISLPAMLDVGVMPVSLRLRTEDGADAEVMVPLLIEAGRYDFERIDLPPDRQSLLDPGAGQAEAAKIAALRMLRSPERYWTYPFGLPVQAAVTSYYGSRRSYGYGFGSYHAGTDFDGEVGIPVVAPSPGVVVSAESMVVRGNAILIDHGWGVVTGYWHLSQIGVEVGQHVAAGELIGRLGNTGLSTGAHLHWELWVNGVAVNVLSWLDPDGPAALLGAAP